MTWGRGVGVITEGKAYAGKFSFRFLAFLQGFPSSLTLEEVLKSVIKQLKKEKKGRPTPLVITTHSPCLKIPLPTFFSKRMQFF